MMKFSSLFAGIAWQGIWPQKPWFHMKKSTDDFFENFITNTLFDFSLEQSFGEGSKFVHMTMKLSEL